MKKPARGFTLIELLVTISILAILALIAITLFGNVQKKSRDGKRIADVNAIADALEAHYGDIACGTDTPYCAVDPDRWFSARKEPTYPKPPDKSYVISALPSDAYTVCAELELGNGNFSDPDAVNYAEREAATFYCRRNQQ